MNFQLFKCILGIIIAICNIDSSLTKPNSNDETLSRFQDSQALETVSSSVNNFAADLYKKTSKYSRGNLVTSPIGVHIILSMARYGASENTEVEMRTALHLPNDNTNTLRGYKSLIDSLNSVEGEELSMANKIFLDKDIDVKPEFTSITKNSFNSEAQRVELTNSREATRIINSWCKAATNNHIRNIVKPDDLAESLMVLATAVYFKGIWKYKFNPTDTLNNNFHISENRINKVPMMKQRNEFNYGLISELDAVYVELPYKSENENDAITMFIIRPNEVSGLKKAQDNIEKVNFKNLHNEKMMTDLNLSLPKFHIEDTIDLKPILKDMGVHAMFQFAMFDHISDIQLKVGKVIQKAFIEVNEEGSEAAAVTAGIGYHRTTMYTRQDPIDLSIDRPFMYCIYHPPTNTILFQGHIRFPTKNIS